MCAPTAVREPVPPLVAERFARCPPAVRDVLLGLRELIFDVAAGAGVGELEESLKWGEPAYRPRNGAGTTVRIDWKARDRGVVYLFVPCQTDLVDRWRGRFEGVLEFQGQRAIRLCWEEPLPEGALRICLEDALTYHRRDR